MARDLRQFLQFLESRGQLRRISAPVSRDLEIAEISNRMLMAGGPALLFESVQGSSMPVVVNLLGTTDRVCWAMGMESTRELEVLGEKLGKLQSPKPPKQLSQAIEFGKILWDVIKAKPRGTLGKAPCQEEIYTGEAVDLDRLPLIRPWSKDAGYIITLGLVITKDPENGIPNVSVYRLQQQSKNTMTVQWLSIRGGARHLRKAQAMGQKLEIAIALGVDPLLIMAAATPIPIDLSEWLFAGLYGGEGVQLVKCHTLDLEVPAHAEIILEGTIDPQEFGSDGPFGDHMGYYGQVNDRAPLIRFHCLTQRHNPIYLTTFSGRPPKEEAMIAIALNRIYTPILRQQFPEIRDFFLPMEALSYKMAILAIQKSYPGQARRAALAFWSALPQFTYTKFVVVVDSDINIRDPRAVIWAICSRVDPSRDVFIIPDTPFDSLDFACARPGLGSRMGIDATIKIPPESDQVWGEALAPDPAIQALCDRRWAEYGLADLVLTDASPNLFGYEFNP
jgi:4-hydroxy-3-polyprenylbenzoate decarboxylase